jgi:hypothetical protein
LGVRNLFSVFVNDRTFCFAKLLANGIHLLAQEVFALLFLRARIDFIADALP